MLNTCNIYEKIAAFLQLLWSHSRLHTYKTLSGRRLFVYVGDDSDSCKWREGGLKLCRLLSTEATSDPITG